jgi:uncharacterized membrane protein YkoI
MLRRIYAALMIVFTMFGGTHTPQQSVQATTDTTTDNTRQASVQSTTPTTSMISQSDAEEIALNFLGVSREGVRMDRTELDREKGLAVWEVEFYYENTEYDFDINAMTGEILRTRPNTDKVITPTPLPTVSDNVSADTTELTKDQALAIALEHAGLNLEEISRFKVEKDRENGVYVYEIDFEKGIMEYEYEIRISDGKLLKWDKEIDD